MSSSEWSFPQPHTPHSSRRHAANRGPRRSPWGLLLLILLILSMMATGLWWVFLRDKSENGAIPDIGSGKACSGQVTKLQITLDPMVTPVVHKAAEAVAREGNGCDKFSLNEQSTEATVAELTSGTFKRDKGDAWMPTSTGWVGAAAAKGQIFPASGLSVARSPLVLVLPSPQTAGQALAVAQQIAVGTAKLKGQTLTPEPLPTSVEQIGLKASNWQTFYAAANTAAGENRVKFSLPDAQKTTAGMLSIFAAQQALSQLGPAESGKSDEGIGLLRALQFKSMATTSTASMDQLFQSLKDGQKQVFPALEYDAWNFSKTNPTASMAVIYPRDAVAVADFPLVSAKGLDPPKADMVRRLGEKLTSPAMNSAWTDRGLRPATGDERPPSITFPTQALMTAKTAQLQWEPLLVGASVSDWVNYSQAPFSVLALIDQSGSMNDVVPDTNGKTKAQVLQAAGFEAAELFGVDTSLGVWMFGQPRQTPTQVETSSHVEAIPYGKMDDQIDGKPRRLLTAGLISGLTISPYTQTPLFATVLDGIKFMQSKATADSLTMVVVLTDGVDEGSSFSMTRQKFLEEYAKIHDPTHRVVVFPIAFGADADVAALQDMATASLQGLPQEVIRVLGTVTKATDPTDLAKAIARVFKLVRSPEVAKLRMAQAQAAAAASGGQ